MIRFNIFDKLTKNQEVSEIALCAMYDFLKELLEEYEKSSFHRIKEAFELCDETLRDQNMGGEYDDNPF